MILRLAQGFSTGGEWGGAAAFLVEHAPAGKRGFVGSFHQVATQIGNFTGFILAALLAIVFTTEAFQQWGWRIAFLFGALLAPVGYYLRTRVAETPVFQQAEARKKVASSPLRVIFTRALAARYRRRLHRCDRGDRLDHVPDLFEPIRSPAAQA